MYTIREAKQAVKHGVQGYLLKDDTGEYQIRAVDRLPLYLQGAPGIGKTQIAKQAADELGIGFVSFSLVHHTKNSLMGLPVINDLPNGDKYTTYTISEIIAKVMEAVENGQPEGILLLDEFPCISETIYPIMLAFLQSKNIGNHVLPDGWVMVLCGNPPQYNKAARKFDAALTDRMRKIDIEFSADDFLTFARERKLHDSIQSFLTLYPEHVYRYLRQGSNEELVTCRSWENLSHSICAYEKLENPVDRPLIEQFIKSEEIAADFYEYYCQLARGMKDEEYKQILCGEWSEETQKRYAELEFSEKLRACEFITDALKKSADRLRGKNLSEKSKSVAALSKQTGNVFRFLKLVDKTRTASEKLFQEINNDAVLASVMAKKAPAEYVEFCKKMFKSA